MSVFFQKGRQRMQRTNFYNAIAFLFFMIASLSVGCAEDSKTLDLPKLPQRSEKLEDFVPDFWNVEFFRLDDLNKDDQLDTVMVVKDRDDANFIRPKDCDSSAPIDTNPRILIVLFADGKSWRLIKQNTLSFRKLLQVSIAKTSSTA